MTPRCGRPMRRYEAVHGALLEDPTCGLRLDHAGQCRSGLSLKRERERRRPGDRVQQERRRRDQRLAAAEQAAAPSPGQRIREARRQARMTQLALSAAVGVCQQSVSDWELDLLAPGPGMLARVAAVTGAPSERAA